jgi:hypothetical protein
MDLMPRIIRIVVSPREWQRSYFASVFGVLAIAAAFWVLARMFAPGATLERFVCVISLLHVFYLYYLGAQPLLGLPENDATQFVAIALVLAIVASTLGGGAVGALGLL